MEEEKEEEEEAEEAEEEEEEEEAGRSQCIAGRAELSRRHRHTPQAETGQNIQWTANETSRNLTKRFRENNDNDLKIKKKHIKG